MYMARADIMENTTAGRLESSTADNVNKWVGCDFCGSERTALKCMGDVWLCVPCVIRLEEEIEAVEALMDWEPEEE